MPNIKLVLEYDGSGFHGWQTQPGLRTIQQTLQETISTVLREKIAHVQASGRTDAGVHARAQVANFFCEEEPDLSRLSHSISNILKGEVSVISAEIVPDDFHSRRSSKSKQYTYRILNRAVPAVLDKGRVWHVASKLDRERIVSEAALLVGEHDFSSFRGAKCGARSPIKEIYESELLVDGDYLYYRVVGNGFLKQMIRNIVGTLVGLAKGSLSETSVLEILEAKDRERAGVTAPAYGLQLDWVKY